MKAALAFLDILIGSPRNLTAADVARVHAAGVDDRGLDDLVQVCALFTIYTRVADALGFEIPSEEVLNRGADIVLKHGYDL